MQESNRPTLQLASPSDYGVYQQFARAFSVRQGNINEMTAPGYRDAGELAGKLIIEEAKELIDALNTFLTSPTLENLVEVADGAGDLKYVVNQLCWSLDIPIDAVYQEIHNNNMTKVQEDGTVKRRADGKVLKPDGYVPVKLWPVLMRHSDARAIMDKTLGADNWNQVGFSEAPSGWPFPTGR